MKLYWHFLLILAVVFLQISVFPFSNSWFYFYFVPIPALIFALKEEKEKALFWAGTSGALIDLFSPLRFGTFTVSYLAATVVLIYVMARFSKNIPVSLTFVVFYFAFLAINLATCLFSWGWSSYFVFVNPMIGALMSAVAFMLFSHFVNKNEYI